MNSVPFLTNLAKAVNQSDMVSDRTGMLFACWAILIVLIAVFVIFMRTHRHDYAVAIIPLGIVPFIHICSAWVSNHLATVIALKPAELQIVMDVAAALIACVLTGYFSQRIKQRATRLSLIFACSGFIIILTLALAINIMVTTNVI